LQTNLEKGLSLIRHSSASWNPGVFDND